MTTEAIQNALILHCRATADSLDLEPAQPNVDVDPSVLPRLEFGFNLATREDETLNGGPIYETWVFTATICVEKGSTSSTGNNPADQIAALFPKGQVIPMTGATLKVVRPPQVRDGYPDKSCWRVPVVVRVTAKIPA